MFQEAGEFAEFFKGFIPYYLLFALPLFIIMSPVNPVAAAHEFPAYRMQQFDLHGVHHGCRSAPVSLEGRSINSWSTTRHCVVTNLQDLTVSQFRLICSRAGALLIMLPQDLANLSEAEKETLMTLEMSMLEEEVSIPVYFAQWSSQLNNIVQDIEVSSSTQGPQGSAAEALLSAISANGYHITIAANQASPRSDVVISSIHGKLIGNGLEDKLPTLVIVAHYDSFGVAPELSFGADSNASGVAMLLELARLFSHLYADPRTQARYNLLFLLTGAGKMNFQGSKRWLEEQLDGPEPTLPQDGTFVLCLDSVAGAKQLHFHVSKPPKEGSIGDRLSRELRNAALREKVPSFNITHKKINLADEMLAWEHERFSMKRLAAATLSSLKVIQRRASYSLTWVPNHRVLRGHPTAKSHCHHQDSNLCKSHRELSRTSIMDIRDGVNVTTLARNTRLVAAAIANHIYNIGGGHILGNQLNVEEDSLRTWLDYLTLQPRSAQILAYKQNPVLNTLHEAMSRYLKGVKVIQQIPDKRDPEVVFYDVTRAAVNIYNVKPAVFDLILTLAIVVYLVTIHFFIQKFSVLYNAVSRLVSVKKSKVQ